MRSRAIADAATARQRWFRTGTGEVVKSAGFFLLMLALAVFIYAAYRSYAQRDRNNGDVVGEPPGEGTTPSRRDPGGAAPAGPVKGGTTAAPVTGSAAGVTSGPAAIPATDSIAPNPPDGLAFGGAGHFQVYRQGDITWRLNTETGATCVLFATDAQWRQPRVRQAACRGAGH